MRDKNLANEQLRSAREYGAGLARWVKTEYGTNDVFKLVGCVGVKVEYGRWSLVTVGEFEPRTSTISVNLAAIERARGYSESWLSSLTLVRVIVAHELGHFFAAQFSFKAHGSEKKFFGGRDDVSRLAEQVAHGFTGELLQLPFAAEECERLWRS